MSVPADAMQAGGVAPWNTPPPSAPAAGASSIAPWDTPPPAAPVASTPAQANAATDYMVKDAAHGWPPAQQEAERAKVWGNSPSSTPDLGPNPTLQKNGPGFERLAGDVAGLNSTPQTQHDFSSVGGVLDAAVQRGKQIGQDILGAATGDMASRARLGGDVIAGGRAAVGGALSGTGSLMAGTGELLRDTNAENTVRYAAGGLSKGGHALEHAGAEVSGAQGQEPMFLADGKPNPNYSLEAHAAGAIGSFAPWVIGQGGAELAAGKIIEGTIANSVPETVAGGAEDLVARSARANATKVVARLGVNATLAAAQSGTVGDQVREQFKREPLLAPSMPLYQQAIKLGMSPQQASQAVIDSKASLATAEAFPLILASLEVAPGKSPVVHSALSMGGMGAGQRIATNDATGRPLDYGVPEAFGSGVAAGALFGVAAHGAHGLEAPADASQQPPDNSSEPPAPAPPPAAPSDSGPKGNSLATLAAMRSEKTSQTARQNIADLVASAKAAGVPEGHIQATLTAGQGKSALANMTALHQLITLHQSGKLPAETSHVSPDQGRQGAQAQGHEAAVGAAQGQQAEHGQEAGAGQPAADQPEGGQAEVSPRAAPVVARLQAAGVEAPVHADGRVVVDAAHQQAPVAASIGAHDAAESPLNDRREPTDGQKAAGTYPKGKLLFRSVQGDIKVNIDNVAGSTRTSTNPDEPPSRKMLGGFHAGIIPSTRGADGKPLEALVGPKAHDDSLPVFVIHQTAKDGSFDKSKVVMGVKTARQALNAYRMQYPQSMHAGLTQMEPKVVQMARPQFVDWIKNGPHDVPLHPVSKQPMLKLRQQVPFEASFGNVPHETLDAHVAALNEKHGTQLQVEPTSTGLRIAGDVPRAVAPDLHRSLSKVEGHEQTTIAHADAGSILRAGREENGSVARSGRQEVRPAAPAEQRGRAGVPQGAPEAQEAQPPNWLNKPKSSAPVYQGAQGAHPVSAVGVHYAEKPNLTELPAEKSTDDLANARLFHIREGRDLPAPASKGHPHETRLTNLYDIHKDPEGLGAHGINNGKPDEATMRAIRDAGYDGVVMRGASDNKPIAWVFSHGPIPVKPVGLGGESSSAVRPEPAPKPARGTMAASAPELKELADLRSKQAHGKPLSETEKSRMLDLYDKERHTATIGNNGEALPGVQNRTAFNALEIAGTRGKHVAYIDADKFKAVNDTLGHTAGDQLLKSIATKLSARFGAENVHKLGGDEFVVHHEDAADLESGIDAVNKELRAEVEQGSAHTVQGIGLSRGIGKTLDEAEGRLQINKQERRTARGTSEDRAVKAGPERSEDHAQHQSEHPVVQVPLKDITLSPDVPQFKSGADERGVVEPLGGAFDERGTGPVQLWRRTAGNLELISGRHRYNKALDEPGKTHIAAQIYDESKGFTQQMAASLDAELNIRDGNGKVKDYVQYFSRPQFDGEEGRQQAESRGLLARSTGQRAYTIARQGDHELIAAHQADRLTDEAAYQIAKAAPKNARLQALGMKMVQDGKSITLAANTMRAVMTLAPSKGSGDLFGFDDSAIIENEKLAGAAVAKQRAISDRLAAITGASKRPDLAKAEGVNVHDPMAVAKRIEQLKQEREAWENWPTDPQKVAALRDELGMAPRPEPEAPAPAAPVDTQSHDMFGAPTSADHLDAAERARDAARNGLTGTGRTDMLSGDGDLFAGPRPDQGTIGESTSDYQGDHEPPASDKARAARIAAKKNGTIEEPGDQYGEDGKPASSGQGSQNGAPAGAYSGSMVRAQPLRGDGGNIVDAGRRALHRWLSKYHGTVLGDAIGREFQQSGRSELIGKQAPTSDDLAALSGVYRSPTFEMLHYILTNHIGTIVDESAISSRLPAMSNGWTAPESNSTTDIASILKARAKLTGANKLWMLHNHPSGDPTPSDADMAFTRQMNRALEGEGQDGLVFMGHVVINHTRYAVIEPEGRHAVFPLKHSFPDFRSAPSKAHPLLGANVLTQEDLASVGVRARHDLEGQVGIVVASGRHNTVSQFVTLPPDVLKSPRGPMLLRRLALRGGGNQVFAVLPHNYDPSIEPALARMKGQGILTEVVRHDGSIPSIQPDGTAPANSVLGRAVMAHRVHEDNESYDPNKDERPAPPYELKPDALHPPNVPPFDREQASNLDYSRRSQIVQLKVTQGLHRSALAQADRMIAATNIAFASARAMFDRRPPEVNIRDIARTQRGLPVSDPAAAQFFHAVDQLNKQRVEMIRGFGEGYLENVRAHYFAQGWKDPGEAAKYAEEFQKGTIEGTKGFMRPRDFPTIEDGIKAGLVPTSTNPVDLALDHLRQMDHFIAMHTFMLELKGRNLVKEVAPGERIPALYKAVDDPAFEIAGGMQGRYVVPDQIADYITNFLNKGFDDTAWHTFRSLENMHLALQLGFSLFHAGFTSYDAALSNVDVGRAYLIRGNYKAAGKAMMDAALSPVTAAQGLVNRGPGAKLLKQYLGQLPMDPNTEAVLGALQQGGTRAFMHPTQELNGLHQAVRAFRQGNKLALAGKFIPATLEAVMYPISHYLVPAQKMFARVAMMKFALDMHAKQLGQEPGNYAAIVEGMHPDYLRQIAGKVDDQVNDRLGQMNYDNLAINQYLKQLLQATTTSAGWNIGSARVIAGPFLDTLRALPWSGKKFGVEYGPEEAVAPVARNGTKAENLRFITGRMSYMLTMMAAFSLTNVLGTYLMTGKGPHSVDDLWTMTFPDGTKWSLPTYMKQMYELATDPISTVMNKVHPTVAMLDELARNRNYNGTKIFETGRGDSEFGDIAQHFREAADFFAQKAKPYALENEQRAAATGVSPIERMLPFFGITMAPKYMQRDSFQNYVASRYAQQFYGGTRTQAQEEHSQALSRAVQAIREHKQPDWTGLSMHDRQTANKYARSDPYVGMFSRLQLEQRIHAYNAASPEERQKYNLRRYLFTGSLGDQLQKLPPDDREWAQHELNKIRSE